MLPRNKSLSTTLNSIRTLQSDITPQPLHLKNTTKEILLKSEFKVPNIVHYIWYNTKPVELQFHHLLSIISAHKVLDPDCIYFHTDIEPTGIYWEQAQLIPSLKVNYREPPTSLWGEKVKEPYYYTSHSNVDRIKVLMEYGGIYLDLDTLVIRPLDDLRRYECTVGLEQPTQVCGSAIICSKSSFFLLLWINSYLDDYRINEWAYNSGKVPFKLAKRYPHLVHLEEYRINRPNFNELDQIWGPSKFEWTENYLLHIWYRLWKTLSPYYDGIEPDPHTIKIMNNSFGEIARNIYYGSSDLMGRDDI